MRRRHRRGAVFLWFLLVALVTIGLVGVISIDTSRVFVARRQAQEFASAAALGGTRLYQANLPLLDEAAVRAYVAESFADMKRAGAFSAISTIQPSDVTVVVSDNTDPTWPDQTPPRPPRVTVTLRYRITDLSFVDLVGALIGGESNNVVNGTSRSEAIVCRPGANPTTADGSCTRSAQD
jgi:Flp pilus assembly protein TadG